MAEESRDHIKGGGKLLEPVGNNHRVPHPHMPLSLYPMHPISREHPLLVTTLYQFIAPHAITFLLQ